MPEKPRKSRFFRLRKGKPEEDGAEEETKEEKEETPEKETTEAPKEEPEEEVNEETKEAPKEEAEEESKEETTEELVKEALGVEEAEEKQAKAEALPPALPKPKESGPLRQVKEHIYQLKGTLKALEDKLDRKEITPEEYEKKSKKINSMLAELYEKKIKYELEV